MTASERRRVSVVGERSVEVPPLIDLAAGEISPSIFVDEGLYEVELERVFGRSWLFLAHESQIPTAGDFFSTWMGEDPVVVVRQRDGDIRAFVNSCRHRGARVCRTDDGNARGFTCCYHGWSYGIDGSLTNVPKAESAYGDRIELAEWGLLSVARVESYKGFVFGNFDLDAVSLGEYLGEMTWYLDAMIDRLPGGVVFLPGVQKTRVQGNWKLPSEQFAGDAYHFEMTHSSVIQAMMKAPPRENAENGPPQADNLVEYSVSLPRGHGLGFRNDNRRTTLHRHHEQHLKRWYEEQFPAMEERLGVQRANGPFVSTGTVFPNFTFNGPPFMFMRVLHPKGPNAFESWGFIVVDRDAPPAVREEQRLVTASMFSPGGAAELDDMENWADIQRGLRSPRVRNSVWNYQMELGRTGSHPVFPGNVVETAYTEIPQRGFYEAWFEQMQNGKAAVQ